MPAHDVHAGSLLRIGIAVVAVIAASVTGVFLLLRHWDMSPGADRLRGFDPPAMAAPALQSAPQPDLAQYRAEKQQQLDSMGWVDREHGIAHIPIQAAMDLLARPSAAAASASAQEPR